ncbi:MAG: polysaccharide pyruvyl transferase family protein [Thiotrichales bacterium]|nr:polysaccharide pyruvyl transferase family protein [Thiotrichales bacterium]
MFVRKKSKKPLAVVTALNPSNAGMYSVDLAAEQFLQSLGFDPILFRGQTRKGRRRERFGAQRFRAVPNEKALLDAGGIVYWGDFTTSPLFALQDYASREVESGRCADVEAAFRVWSKKFLLADVKNRSAKVASIGQNFLGLETQISQMPAEDRKLLEICYRNNFDLVCPRDPLSTAEFKSVASGANSRVELGMDAAFLLDHEALFPELSSVTPASSFGYLFGRSDLNERAFVERVEADTGLTPINLAQWLKLNRRKGHSQYRRLLLSIASSRFVITDLYHASINSLALGVPVLGLGKISHAQIGTLSDLKKKILFCALGLDDFYLELTGPELDSELVNEKFSHALANCLSGFEHHRETVMTKRADFRSRLSVVLSELML